MLTKHSCKRFYVVCKLSQPWSRSFCFHCAIMAPLKKMCYLYLVFWRLTSSPYFLLLWCFSSLLLSSPDCKRNAVSTCQSINPSKSLIFDNMIWLTHNLSISLYTDSANCLNALAYMRLQKSKLSIFCCLNSYQSLLFDANTTGCQL